MKRVFCILLAVSLLLSVAAFAETPAEGLSEGDFSASPGDAAEDEEGFMPSGGDGSAAPDGMNSLTDENFSVDDMPDKYIEACDQPGRVEKVRYKVYTDEGTQVRTATVYLPVGYDDNEDRYNVLYLFHASSGTPLNYLNPDKETAFKNLLDNMIADGLLEPLIVVAATYYPTEGFTKYMPLPMQVEQLIDFPTELVEVIIPAVEENYRTYAESLDIEGITASRDHRGIAGFSLGGVVTWNVFQQQMKAFRWFLPISEASWSDAEGGTSGIWDSDVSAQVLYDAVIEQGYAKDDFRLFVATGTEDEAFDISTSQMVSLLEYDDMFKPGENTACSMMAGGTHTISAVYTYLYHIMPSLFSDR